MNVFLTGATGFVGRNLAKSLLDRGYRISCLVRDVVKARNILGPNAKFIEGDLTDFDVNGVPLRNALLNADIVCHLAACVSSSRVRDFFGVNAGGTQKLCDLLLESKRLKKFLYLSSLAVVGGNQAKPITEATPTRPSSPYGRSKLEAEKIVTNFHNRFSQAESFIVRAPVVYGMGQSKLTSLFFKKIGRGPIVHLCDGKNIRGLCYIENLSEAILSLIEKQKISSRIEIVNVADRKQIDLEDLVLLIARKWGTEIKIRRMPKLMSLSALAFYQTLNRAGFNSAGLFALATASANMQCDIGKALSLKIPLKHRLEDGIEETVRWLKQDKMQGRKE